MVEQDAESWVTGLAAVVADLFAGRAMADLAAIGITSQVNTHVFVDAAGTPLMPAIVWQDGRADDEARRLDALISPEDRERWWKSAMQVSASHTVARAAWVQAERPDIWARTARILSPKDFLLRRITGIWTSDPLSCFDIVDGAGAYIDDLIALVPGLAERLPPLRQHTDIVGRPVHPIFAGSDAIVVNGTMDGFACLIGAGAKAPGEGSYTSGTCEIVALISDQPGEAPGVVAFMPVGGWHIQAGPTQSGGDSLRWLAALLDRPLTEVLALAERADRAAATPFFLPHLQGERAPLWDAQARGSVLGLTAADGAAELALAVLEGVACSARLLFEAAVPATGRTFDFLYLGGGGSRSDFWAQIRADVLGIPLHRVACRDTGPVGAAIMAGLGAGLFASVAAASEKLVQVDRVFVPDPAMAPRYERLMARYRAAYAGLRGVYAPTPLPTGEGGAQPQAGRVRGTALTV